MDMEIRLDVEDVREWLRQYVGSSHMGFITVGYLSEIDSASPQHLLEIIDQLGVSDQIKKI